MLLAVLAGVVGFGPVAGASGADPQRPNIVFVLADDLDWSLVPYMPEVQRLQRDGVTLEQFVVSASLCCVSRASILTGRYPHNTRVLTNSPPSGGYLAWTYYGNAARSFAVPLAAAGYRTGMFGKYLNGYGANVPPDPGWTGWLAGSDAYFGFDYDLSDNGFPVRFAGAPTDYATDVVARGGVRFIRESVAAGKPFMVELSTFTPHRPAVPAPRHAQLFQDLELPMTGAFGRAIHDPPRWLGKRRALSGADLAELRERFRRRARSVQAIDEMLGMVRRTLDELGVAGNTYVVFTSDNGYHLGQYRLTHGKRTPYDADIRVPTVIAGPGLPAAVASTALASNVDFAPTFLHWAGAERRGQDGRSLDRVLRGQTPRRWRRGVLVVHHLDERPPRRTDFGARLAQDPDAQDWRMGMPGTYAAIRTRDHLYVQHRNGSRELYDLRRDPDELQNLAGSMGAGARARWALRLARLAACAGASCRRADRFR
ncbi:MAG: sulfatase [Solirubrobacteraceae bacterium]